MPITNQKIMPERVRNEPLYEIGVNQKCGHIIFNKNFSGFRMLASQAPLSIQALMSNPVPFIIPVIISSMVLLFITVELTGASLFERFVKHLLLYYYLACLNKNQTLHLKAVPNDASYALEVLCPEILNKVFRQMQKASLRLIVECCH